MKKFWNFRNEVPLAPDQGRALILEGVISEESWWDDEITPKMFRDELNSGTGPIAVYINSPGGDCVAASQIYTMLTEYPGRVTVKIDGTAASAASVVAMAGDEVLMSLTAMMMIHNPMTGAWGNTDDMKQAIEMLDEVKESIINAYERKTGLSRAKISHLMDAETWMNAKKAVELGFADGFIGECDHAADAIAFETKTTQAQLMQKAVALAKEKPKHIGRSVDERLKKLNSLKY